MAEIPPGIDQSGMIDPTRQAQIDKIEAYNKANLLKTASDLAKKESIDIDFEAAQYLIPTRALELANDPSKVMVRILDSKDSMFNFAVAELGDQLLSDPASIQHMQTSITRPPGHVDFMHANLLSEIQRGQIGLRDKVFAEMTVLRFGNELFVSHYMDNPQTQGQKVTDGLYKKLREVAKAVGCRIITGENTLPDPHHPNPVQRRGNIGYFLEKLDRSRFSDLTAEEQTKIQAIHPIPIEKPEAFTIDYLYPEDKPQAPPSAE